MLPLNNETGVKKFDLMLTKLQLTLIPFKVHPFLIYIPLRTALSLFKTGL